MRKITSALLRQKGACSGEVEQFVELGGDHLEFTEALCLEHADKFDLNWAARVLLTPAAFQMHWRSQRNAAHREYMRRMSRWWVIWDLGEDIWCDYKNACASAFYRAWVSPENQND
jgi:hypothetical protein